MQRETLIDFFRDLSATRGEFLVYDDGYRRRSHSYQDVGRAARGFAAPQPIFSLMRPRPDPQTEIVLRAGDNERVAAEHISQGRLFSTERT